MDVASETLKAHDRMRAQAHSGLPRALLGRALEAPPPCVSMGVMTSAASQDSRLTRWERLRQVLLPRLAKRGMFGLADLRKALTVQGQAALIKWENVKHFTWPDACDPPLPEDALLLRAEDIAFVLLSDCGLEVRDEDLKLMELTWSVPSDGNIHETFVDAHAFCDALRGEPSPGRHQCVMRLYTQLQRDAGIPEHSSLDADWLASRLWPTLRPWNRPGVKLPPFTPDDLLGALPLLRSHSALTRAAFLRCTADLAFTIASHSEFIEFIYRVWGLEVEVKPLESELWNFGSEAACHPSGGEMSITPVSITPSSTRPCSTTPD